MKTKNYIILSLLFLSILGGLLYFNTVLVDTQAYVPSVYYMQGLDLWEEDVERVLVSYAFKRPIEVTLVSLIEPFMGVRNAYAFFNLGIYILTTILTFSYVKNKFKKENDAKLIGYVAALLCATSLPLIIYATRVLVDVAGYFTIILGLIVIDKILEKKNVYWFHHAAVSALLGLSMLVRDAAIILYPYYGIQYFLKCKASRPLKTIAIREILTKLVAMWPFALTLLPQAAFMHYFGVGSILSGKATMITAGKYSLLGWLKFILVHGAAFHIAWIAALVGFIWDKNKTRRTFYLVYLASAMVYLVGIQLVALTSPRFSMVLFPVVLAAAAFAIVRSTQKWEHAIQRIRLNSTSWIVIMVAIYALLSFFMAWLYPAHGIITEDAGGDVVIHAVLNEIKIKLGGVF